MSRFSPDTWLDAIQLPLAMAQFKGNVYVEPIAPDLRPVAFICLLVAACLVTAVRYRLKNFKPEKAPIEFSRRTAWALMTATAISLCAWIFSSGNGRYGLVAITLTPLAALAALLVTTSSIRMYLLVLGLLTSVQAIFFITADPDDTWSKLTLYRWTEKHADSLPPEKYATWRAIADKNSTLIVTTRTLTGMSTLYQVFGSNAKYMGLGYIDLFSENSSEYRRALQLVQSAEKVYLSYARQENPDKNDGALMDSKNTLLGDRQRLRKFGLAINDQEKCTLLPSRMGAQLQICSLIKVAPENFLSSDPLPDEPLRVLRALGVKCPGVLDDARPPVSDKAGGIATQVHDGKYFVEILSTLDVYIRHRGETGRRLLVAGEKINDINDYSCKTLMGAGLQYWR